jgi:trigger factor
MQLSVAAAPRCRAILELEFAPDEVIAALSEPAPVDGGSAPPSNDAMPPRPRTAGAGDARRDGTQVSAAPPVIRRLIERSLADALTVMKIRPLNAPDPTVLSAGPGRPMLVQATVELRPEVALGRYWEFAGEPTVVRVAEIEVDAELESMRESAAIVREVVNRTPRTGERMLVAVRAEHAGAVLPEFTTDTLDVTAGIDPILPALMDLLLIMRPGERRDVELGIPDDWSSPFAGQSVAFRVVLRHLRRRVLPDLDDELAQRYGCATVSELRDEARHRLEEAALDRARHAFAEALLASAVASSELLMPGLVMVGPTKRTAGGLPDALIEQQMDLLAAMRAVLAEADGVNGAPGAVATDTGAAGAFGEPAGDRQLAEERVMALLVLSAIAESERITIDETSVDDTVAAIRSAVDSDPAVDAYLAAGVGRAFVSNTLARQAAIDRVVDVWLADHPASPTLSHLGGGHPALDRIAARAAARIGYVDPATLGGEANPLVGAVPEQLRAQRG